MFYRKRGKKWEYRLELGIIDGKRKQFTKGGFKTKKEAEFAASKKLKEFYDTGNVLKENEISFVDFAKIYIDENKMYWKETTLYTKETVFKTHLIPYFENFKLKNIKPSLIQKFINEKYNAGYSNSYLNKLYSELKLLFNYAKEPYQYISISPVDSVKLIKNKYEKHQISVYTHSEMDAIFSQVKDSSYEIFVAIARWTGMRRGEILGLTWDNISDEYITIESNLVAANNAYFLTRPKTVNSQRVIPIPNELQYYFHKQKQFQEQCKVKYKSFYVYNHIKDNKLYFDSKTKNSINFVCTNIDGSFINIVQSNSQRQSISNKLKMKISFHQFRHTRATELLNSGHDIKYVQSILGHASVSTTYDKYINLSLK